MWLQYSRIGRWRSYLFGEKDVHRPEPGRQVRSSPGRSSRGRSPADASGRAHDAARGARLIVADGRGPITLHEAADRLGVHYMTAYRYVRLGILPAQKSAALAGRSRRPGPAGGDARPPSRRRRGDGAGPTHAAMGGPTAAAAAGAATSTAAGRSSRRRWRPASSPRRLRRYPGPALHAIGDVWRWATSASSRSTSRAASPPPSIGRLGPRFRRRGRTARDHHRRDAAGERHGLGVAMLADILRGDGFAVLQPRPGHPGRVARRGDAGGGPADRRRRQRRRRRSSPGRRRCWQRLAATVPSVP